MMDESRSENLTTMDPATGEIIQYRGATIDDLLVRDTGSATTDVRTSIDTSTPKGRCQLGKHVDFQNPQNQKVNEGWYGREFHMVAWSSRVVGTKKGFNGEQLAAARPLLRTVVECDNGSMFSSSSAWLLRSLMEIVDECGQPSDENPILVKLGKAGAADRLFRVREQAARSNGAAKISARGE
jgi:hypothetical protein